MEEIDTKGTHLLQEVQAVAESGPGVIKDLRWKIMYFKCRFVWTTTRSIPNPSFFRLKVLSSFNHLPEWEKKENNVINPL